MPDNLKKYLDNPNSSTMFITPTNPHEIDHIIKQLKINKSPGADNAHPKNIKGNTAVISPLLNHLVFITGEYPE